VFSFFDAIITVHVVAQCQSNTGFLISSKGVYTRIKIHTVSSRISRSDFCTKMLPCEHRQEIHFVLKIFNAEIGMHIVRGVRIAVRLHTLCRKFPC
jgi:hypothetical protein